MGRAGKSGGGMEEFALLVHVTYQQLDKTEPRGGII